MSAVSRFPLVRHLGKIHLVFRQLGPIKMARKVTSVAETAPARSRGRPATIRATAFVGSFAAIALSTAIPIAHADRAQPPPLYGFYNVYVDFSKQTFNGAPTPMDSRTFLVEFTTHCDVSGCVASMDNSGDLARNPGAPAAFEYRWKNGRWETSGPYPYFCERMNPDSAVKSVRADYLIPKPDGSFFGERTLTVEGAGCPGEGPGVHRLPISVTPTNPPPRKM